MTDNKLPSNWVNKLSKTKNTTATSSSSSVKYSIPASSSLNKLNSSSIVIKKTPAQDRLKRIQQELIAKQISKTKLFAATIAKPNDTKSTHRIASPKSATKHSNLDTTTKSPPSNSSPIKTSSSSIPTPSNTKTSVAIPRQDSINHSRNIKLPCKPTVPLSNRLKFKIPKIDVLNKPLVQKYLPNTAGNASESKIGNCNQNNRKRKPYNAQPVFKMGLIDGTEEPNTMKRCTGQPDTKDSNIGSAISQSQVSSITPSLPEAAALANRNIRKAEYTEQADIAETTLVGQKNAPSKNLSEHPNPTLPNAVLSTNSAAPISESVHETPSTKPISTPLVLKDSISNCSGGQRLESTSIFASIFSGLKSFTQRLGVAATSPEQVVTNNDALPKHNSSTRRQLDSVTFSGKGILNSSKIELSALQQRLQLNKEDVPAFKDSNVLRGSRDNSPLDNIEVEMTDDDDMTSDSNESMEWENVVPNEVEKIANETVESAKVPVSEIPPKPDPLIIKPIDFMSSNASKRTSGSLVAQRLLIHKSPEPRLIPDKVPIRQYSPPPTAKLKLTIKSGETILVVIDTNIFLNSLSFVKNLINQRQKLKGNPTLMVPYQVLQELDNIKDCSKKNDSIKSLAMDSIKYLEKHLQGSDERVQAQSVQDNQRNIIDIGSPDDRILNCCLQCQSLESKHIVLLSNDINLRNKALCSKVTAFSMAQLAEELNIK